MLVFPRVLSAREPRLYWPGRLESSPGTKESLFAFWNAWFPSLISDLVEARVWYHFDTICYLPSVAPEGMTLGEPSSTTEYLPMKFIAIDRNS